MSIPKYFEMYRAFLECIKDRKVHTMKEEKAALVDVIKQAEYIMNDNR
jgi:hypothetical protein